MDTTTTTTTTTTERGRPFRDLAEELRACGWEPAEAITDREYADAHGAARHACRCDDALGTWDQRVEVFVHPSRGARRVYGVCERCGVWARA